MARNLQIYFSLYFSALGFAIACLLFSLFYGSTSFNSYWLQENQSASLILLKLRLPRTLAAFTSGGLLALSGSLMQLLLQNPLADPYVLGISGGAAMTTLVMMLFGLNEVWLLPGAWAGSLIAILLILLLAKKHHFQPHTLLLTGIAIACGFSAAISLILIMSPSTTLHSMLFWLTGDLNDAELPIIPLTILIAGFFSCLVLSPGFNILLRGDREASALGLPIKRYRLTLYLLSSLFTATAVTLSGCIGFVGLIMPHIARLLVGADHRKNLPIAVLLGGSLVTLADTLARSLIAPQQLPVGILLAVIGVPVFIWLLRK